MESRSNDTPLSDLIIPYQNAHKMFVHLDAPLEGSDSPVYASYEYAIVRLPELAQFKMYHDSSTFITEGIQTETGDRLVALLMWVNLLNDFWERCGISGTCPQYVAMYHIVEAQSFRHQILQKLASTKPHRRAGKKSQKIKSPKLTSVDAGRAFGFH